MSSIDQQFVEYIVKSLVGNPDAVKIDRRIDEKGVLLELTVDPEDLGRVIGKRGATAQSLRTLLRALGTKNEARYNLKIVDNGEPRPPREDSGSSSQPQQDDNQTSQPVSDDDSTAAPVDKEEVAPAVEDSGISNSDSTDSESDSWGSTSTAKKSSSSDDLDLDDDDEPKEAGDKLSQTRKELEDLDDLDV